MGVNETKQATRDLYRLGENLHTRLTAARQFSDDRLTPEAQLAEREIMASNSHRAAVQKATALLNAARDGEAFAQSKVDAARPKTDPADIASLSRSSQAWHGIVEPARANGASWADIAQAGDMDTLAALNRFAEQSINLHESRADAPIITANMRGAIDRRLAEIHPDPQTREVFQDARDARAHLDLAEHLAGAVNTRDPEHLLGSLIAAKSYAHRTGIDLSKDPKPTAPELDRQVTQMPYSPTALA